ncbi:hypothetical protein L2E82_26852 [Cichorium intybus]|uniref:Uncharacterized protein n=1 Tax=Cichorium intybus TaxID=13427 RepID=A0ACB9CRM1_CICIN|nr:hypothetical protein L2E82_26852 [Cichorium intybus]
MHAIMLFGDTRGWSAVDSITSEFGCTFVRYGVMHLLLQLTTMALFNKMGNILKQTVSKNGNYEMLATNPSIFQMIRSMSSSKLFVGGLSYATDEMSLRDAFSAYGDVQEARVIVDRETGRSRGFGFITFSDIQAAAAAIQALDQRELHGRVIKVNYAIDRPQAGGGGYRGGGYSANSYGSGGYGSFGSDSQSFGVAGGAGGGNGFTNGGYGGNSYSSGGFATKVVNNVGSVDGGRGDASIA